MTCKYCNTDNGEARKTCSRCGEFLVGYCFNNVTGEYGYRGENGMFYKDENEYLLKSINKN